jgi:hypothetical protein
MSLSLFTPINSCRLVSARFSPLLFSLLAPLMMNEIPRAGDTEWFASASLRKALLLLRYSYLLQVSRRFIFLPL